MVLIPDWDIRGKANIQYTIHFKRYKTKPVNLVFVPPLLSSNDSVIKNVTVLVSDAGTVVVMIVW